MRFYVTGRIDILFAPARAQQFFVSHYPVGIPQQVLQQAELGWSEADRFTYDPDCTPIKIDTEMGV